MDSNFSDIIRWAIVPAAVVGGMALARKFFPARKTTHAVVDLDSDELYDRFMPLRSRIIGAMILIGVLFFFGTWKALGELNHFLAGLDGATAFYLQPQSAIWWFFPLFGALVLSWEVTLQIWARFSGHETVNLFSDWSNHSSAFWGVASYPGMDSRRVLRWMALLIALPIGVFTVLALNMHATIGPDAIRDYGYAFKPCAVYRLVDVSRMTQIEGFGTKDGKLTRRAGGVLDFKDERRWSSAEWGDFKEAIDPALAEFLIEKTGLRMNYATTEEDIPPLI